AVQHVQSLPGACGDGSAGPHLAGGRRVTHAPSYPGAGVRGCLPALADALEADAQLDTAALGPFLAAKVESGLVHGSRPLCRVLSPLVVTGAVYRRVARAAELLLSAMGRLGARARIDAVSAALYIC